MSNIPSSELLDALLLLGDVLKERDATYALIGGLAVAVRGPMRATRDIDLMLRVPQLQLPPLLESLHGRGFDVDVYRSIAAWNREHLFTFRRGAIQVDCIKAVLPVFERILERAKWEDVAGHPLRVADAEGILLLKLIAFRPRDEEDIRGILAANRERLDLDWVRQQWRDISEADDPRNFQFEQLVRESYSAS